VDGYGFVFSYCFQIIDKVLLLSTANSSIAKQLADGQAELGVAHVGQLLQLVKQILDAARQLCVDVVAVLYDFIHLHNPSPP
jgi:hypothetical protein